MKNGAGRKLIIGSLLSVVVFLVLCVISYFIYADEYGFKIGLPMPFYYEFMVDGEAQHGTIHANLRGDIMVAWMSTVITWFFIKRNK